MGLVKRQNKRGDFTWYVRYRYQGKDRWKAIGPSKRQAELADWRFKCEVGVLAAIADI